MEPSRTAKRRSISVLDWVATFLQKNSVFPDIRSVVIDMGTADSQPLQKQLKELKDGRANDEATIMMLRTQVAALQATAVQEGNAAQETIESLQARVAALEHDKTSAEEQTTRANAKMTRAASARKEMKAVLQRREAELQKAEKKLHDTMRDSNETQRKFEILEAELDRKTRELEKAGALTERVAAYARDLESERESLEEQLEESKKAIPVVEEVGELQKELQEFRDAHAAEVAVLSMAVRHALDLMRQVEDTEQLKAHDARAEMQQQHEAHIGQLKQLASRAFELKEAELQAARAQAHQMQDVLAACMGNLAASGMETEHLRSVASGLQQRLDQSLTALPIIREAHCPFVGPLGAGACATPESGGLRCLGMEYIPGCTLDSWLWSSDGSACRSVEVPQQLSIMVQLTRALVHALERGRVHADIKPDNILINDAGRVFIIDWGLSYRAGEARAGWSETPGYIRPEGAFHPELIVAADDVRALCMIGTGMAAGHPIDEELRARCQWHENIPDVKEEITAQCRLAGLNERNEWERMIAAEYLGYSGFNKDDFAEVLHQDPSLPLDYMRLLQRGLCWKPAHGEAAMPTLQDFADVLHREMCAWGNSPQLSA
ncbi:hypothetical protein WJX75_001315 [Coccomyxa subellipsoidea]|uniref:Protein kinase domain-containing protein n=1 Tax=Coccomyxa subellipsoidea TaxID=248742 RepID=A0ABR2YC84_9CHLO